MARTSKKIKPNKVYTVVCCGHTESIYLDTYKRKNRLHYTIKTHIKSVRPDQQLAHAKKKCRGSDACYVLFDYDSFFDDVSEAKRIIEEFERSANHKVVLSNECFDLWIWAHFKKLTNSFIARGDIFKKLDKIFGAKYDSLKADVKKIGKLIDEIDVAVQNSQLIADKRYTNPSFDLSNFLEIISK